MDPALAGLLGALVGGGFTFAGSIIGNTQQARRARDDRRQERKVEAYSNAMRCLLRSLQWRSLSPKGSAWDGAPVVVGGRTWFEEFADAEYWITMLSAVCGSRYRARMQETAVILVDMIAEDTSGQQWENGLRKAYEVVTDAARDDLGSDGQSM